MSAEGVKVRFEQLDPQSVPVMSRVTPTSDNGVGSAIGPLSIGISGPTIGFRTGTVITRPAMLKSTDREAKRIESTLCNVKLTSTDWIGLVKLKLCEVIFSTKPLASEMNLSVVEYVCEATLAVSDFAVENSPAKKAPIEAKKLAIAWKNATTAESIPPIMSRGAETDRKTSMPANRTVLVSRVAIKYFS